MFCTCIDAHDWGKNNILYPQLIYYLGVSIICYEGVIKGMGGVKDSKPLW